MAETSNIATIAEKIYRDIFKVFRWEIYPQKDTNFDCSLEHTNDSGKPKKTHPGDVVFHYMDPYLNKRVHLHTDLKSYAASSIKQNGIRNALKSLAMTIECASISEDWVKKFSIADDEPSEVRGLLFVANHDNASPEMFDDLFSKVSKSNLPISKGQVLHVLSPKNISALFSIATDIKLAIQDNELGSDYRFFYPDLTLWKRHTADDGHSAATIETLMSPYFIVRHDEVVDPNNSKSVLQKPGSLIYYGRDGSKVEEFVYLLDALLRHQLVNSKEQVRIRIFNRNRDPQFKNNFDKAKQKYCRNWGFDSEREKEIRAITIDSISKIEPNYCPDEIGWRVE